MALDYHLLDVFTDRPYTGNPLAVFVDHDDLSTTQMQRIASELHLSETVFVRAPQTAGEPWPTRIFTPERELPFAGHPTVGTAALLAHLEHRALHGASDVVLLEGVGPVAVSVRRGDGTLTATLTTAQLPGLVAVVDPGDVGAALALGAGELYTGLPAEAWSAGLPFTIVAVRDVEVLGSVSADASRWRASVGAGAPNDLYVVTPLDGQPAAASRWRARMFGLGAGIIEDPATGSAAAAFAGYLAALPGSSRLRWDVEQGVEMGRPSVITLDVEREGTGLGAVRVTGACVVVGHGRLAAPPAP